MKARVKATGEIVEVRPYNKDGFAYIQDDGETVYEFHELEILDNPDYWTRLEHQYAGMAMNALLFTNNIRNGDLEGMRECNTNAMAIAHALVEKLKESKV